ncbi:MAG: hypothetical protein ACHQ15_03975 [Candidatus Limnocylindrales bacterium]
MPTGLRNDATRVQGSIATAAVRPAGLASRVAAALRDALGRVGPGWLSLGFAILAGLVYVLSNTERQNFYDHFVWQAEAFLGGHAWIPWPVSSGPFQNSYFQDVYPLPGQPGHALLPFPPLPAILLLPFVAAWGLATNAALICALLGGINVALAWRLTWRLTTDPLVAVLATIFYGFGTVAWYAAMLGSTWFLAHVVASTFLLLAITAALDAERRQWFRRIASAGLIDWRQFGAGLLFGLAAGARFTTIFAAPFFIFVGGGGTTWRRGLSAGLGAAIPFLALLAYNVATTGSLLHPGYDYLYGHEYVPAPAGLLVDLFPSLSGITYHPGDWALQDLHYVPQNAVIMLAWLPDLRPECGLSLLDQACPLLQPDRLGMSLLLTSPAWLLVVPAVVRNLRRRIVLGATLAVLAVALVDLSHFSQGWVQFGYRFSNDFAPFLLILMTLGLARAGVRWWTIGLVAVSIAINAWGVYWGVVLGW